MLNPFVKKIEKIDSTKNEDNEIKDAFYGFNNGILSL